MQILRLPPYPLTISYDVPLPNTDYILVINESARNVNDVTESIVSTAGSKLEYTLPDQFNSYDESYYLAIYEDVEGLPGDIVVEDNLEIMRPYVNPTTLAQSLGFTTATEINDYIKYEGLARAIIDSIVPGGFYYERSWYEVPMEMEQTTFQFGTEFIRLSKVMRIMNLSGTQTMTHKH
jgi:hypothetical protein